MRPTCEIAVLVCAGLLCATQALGAREFPKIDEAERAPPKARLVAPDHETQALLSKPGGHNFTGTPVLFWHGMGDVARGSVSVLAKALRKQLPGLLPLSVQIGENAYEDEMAGYLGDVNLQVQQVCEAILAQPEVKRAGSLNMLGLSQGAQFLRGVLQRCPLRENGIRVRNYVSLGGQHEGVFGLPRCKPTNPICDHIRQLLTHAAYEPSVQQSLVQAQYWHDPTREPLYRQQSHFLGDLNNENQLNLTYKRNLVQLDNMVLVQFLNDTMVTPPESSTFGFFAPNDTHTIHTWTGGRIYKENRLGLRDLFSSYKLQIIKVPGNHLQFTIDWFLEELAKYFR